jgi:L-lactate dehydrogenase complex protein LldG
VNSREKILATVLKNQPQNIPLPETFGFKGEGSNTVQKFVDTLYKIGGKVFLVDSMANIKALIPEHFDTNKRIVTNLSELNDIAELVTSAKADPYGFQDVELTIIAAHLAVAENGAVWITEEIMRQRILPFICKHLAVVISVKDIVPTMHEAYAQISLTNYGFGTFIAGPSKTADIEQSLVLGAHGPKTMTVFAMKT